MNGKLPPYIRYDKTELPHPDADPWYGLREDGGTIMKTFVPEFNAIMVGSSYDWNANMRVKAEAIYHIDGARDRYGVVFQIAWGF